MHSFLHFEAFHEILNKNILQICLLIHIIQYENCFSKYFENFEFINKFIRTLMF